MARTSNTQRSYDFLTGAEAATRPPSREAFRHSNRVSSGHTRESSVGAGETEHQDKSRREIEDLKAEIKSLRYTLDNRKQEEELGKLRHESELREARRRAEDDFKQKQAAEAEKNQAVRQHELLLKEVTEIRDAASNQKAALERQLREAEESKRVLEEEAEDVRSQRELSVRQIERKSAELQSRNDTLQRTIDTLNEDAERREHLCQEAQQQTAEKDCTIGNLEAEVLRLKAQTGDADTLSVIKRELSEQVSHIRTLEATNREQNAELKHFRRLHKSVEVVEEEKRTLQRKVDNIEVLQNELNEATMQCQRLKDERLAWTAYLQSQAGSEGQTEFESPEDLARALIGERLHTATLMERIGSLEAESIEKDGLMQSSEAEKRGLSEQIEKLRLSPVARDLPTIPSESKARMRLERQQALAVKEVEYLRAQLKTFDTEDITFQPENVDHAKIRRILELEDIVDNYRQEVQTLQTELSSVEAPQAEQVSQIGTKRPRDESNQAEESERLGQMARKNRKLQEELNTFQTSTKVLQKELDVVKERLKAATEHCKTRILSLRENPTSNFEAIKQSTLTALQQENTDLLAQIQYSTKVSTVPLSALTACQREITAAEDALKSERKRNDRLKSVWLAKTQEFRELVVSLLGWDVVFMPNGKMRVTSWFYPSKGDEENSIVFDGEKGTMKVSGGPESAFAKKIRSQIAFWVEGRGSIPCFLAALTMEFYEEARGDGTLRVD